jgi:flagellar assembly protein FliH
MQNDSSGSIQEFQYPPSGLSLPSLWEGFPEISVEPERSNKCIPSDPGRVQIHEIEADLPPERIDKIFQAGRAQGIEEGRSAAKEELQKRLMEAETKGIEQAAHLAVQVATEQEAFIHSSEQAVVGLALSIAARILRREAEIDPLFLTGAVRVALGQLSETVAVRLRVPAAEFELWSQTFPHLPGLRSLPVLVSDELMHAGEVLIETDVGSADLGVRSQLTEIARLFEELAPARQKGISLARTAAEVRA